MIKYISIAALCLVSIFLVALLIINMEITENHFDDYSEANVTIEADWLPSWLPKSAYDIHESHDVDSNFMWSNFKVHSKNELLDIPCQKITKETVVFPSKKYIGRFPDFVKKDYSLLYGSNNASYYICGDYQLGVINENLIYTWNMGDR